MQYLIWLGQKQNEYHTIGRYFCSIDGWHLSRTDGREDEHTLACVFNRDLAALQGYCEGNGLEYTIHPLDVVVKQKCTVEFNYRKVA